MELVVEGMTGKDKHVSPWTDHEISGEPLAVHVVFQKMCKFLLRTTLIFILGGPAPVVHSLIVEKSFINVLDGFQKKKFPKLAVVVVF